DLENLLVSQPDNGEQALEIVEVLVRSGAVDVVVVDSVAALVPRAEIEGEMGEAQMGLQARLMSQALRKLTGIVSKSKTSLIFINQLREKSGTWFAFSGERLGQGRENVKQFLKENPAITSAIEDRVRRELGLVKDAKDMEVAAV